MTRAFLHVPLKRTAMLGLAAGVMLTIALVSACSGPAPAATKTTGATKSSPASATRGGASGTGSMSATIDGKNWTSRATTASYKNGGLSVSGADGSSPPVAFAFGLIVNKAGTYETTAQNPIGDASLTTGASVWSTSVLGGSGTVTITSLTSTGASGTFSFSMVPVGQSSAKGTKTVTNGAFSVTFASPVSIPAGPTVAAAAVTAQVNGQAWSSVAAQTSYKDQTLTIFATDGKGNGITLGLAKIPGPGTYSVAYLNPSGSSAIYASATGGWNTFLPGGTGSVTITALSSSRAVGTFSFDGVASSGSGSIHVTDGKFDVTY